MRTAPCRFCRSRPPRLPAPPQSRHAPVTRRPPQPPQSRDATSPPTGNPRLAEILRDPGPGIVVRPLADPTVATDRPAGAPKPSPPAAGSRPSAPAAPAAPQSQAPRPAAAAPPARSAPTSASGLRHLPEAVASRLTSFLDGSEPAAPKIAPPPAAPAPDSGRPRTASSEIQAAIDLSRRAFIATGVFSFFINILMLAGPLFMLQVYDRVMTSGSIPTLVALSVMTALIYGIIGLLELIRSRIVIRIGVEVDQRVGDRIFEASLRRSVAAPGQSLPALRELDNLRQFLASPGPITFFDAPWTPVYLLVIFIVHWTLGLAATLGALMLLALAWFSEARSRAPLAEANKAAAASIELAETGQRNAEAITAMGMMSAYRTRWQNANRDALAWQIVASDRLGTLSSLSKTLRLLGQSLMLAIGAWLAIKNEISAGSIIAGTIIFGRALAPVEQAIGHWRSFLKAFESYRKLDQLLINEPPERARTHLPSPKGRLEVTGLRVAAPETRQLILAGINFTVDPGRMVAVIGPSASGKSTLARALVGLWPPFAGQIRLDGARLDQWHPEDLGQHIGYLPQNVELFAGTVRENIARFRADATDDRVVEAAKQAHAHELILALPNGYETQLGAYGTYLSGGQRQRIALARALYGNPALVVLDEPNSNLDRTGDEALSAAVEGMRKRGQAIVLVAHRVQAISKADHLLYIDGGVQRAFGPTAEVLKLFQAAGAPPSRRSGDGLGLPTDANRLADVRPPAMAPPTGPGRGSSSEPTRAGRNRTPDPAPATAVAATHAEPTETADVIETVPVATGSGPNRDEPVSTPDQTGALRPGKAGSELP